MIAANDYTRLIERLSVEVIPGYKPPVTIVITGKYAKGEQPTRRVSPKTPHFSFNTQVKS